MIFRSASRTSQIAEAGKFKPPVRPKAVRNIRGLPAHLTRVDIMIEPASSACPCCEDQLHLIGDDVSEMLELVPAVLRGRRLQRLRYGCRACEAAVVQAKAPPRLVDDGPDARVHAAWINLSFPSDRREVRDINTLL